jgi:two-component system nitrogen regulation sensor histidine kinase GlnL
LSRPAENRAAPIDPEVILANLVGGIVVLDPGGRIVYVNPAAEAMIGRSKRALMLESGEKIFANRPWLQRLLARLDDGAEASVRDEGRIGPGEGVDVLAVASVLRTAGGSHLGTSLALHDLSTRYRLERDRVAHARVEEQDRMLATLAHELNNPLSGIRGAAQLLGRKLGDLGDAQELANYAQMIVRQSDRMAELVETLLGLSGAAPHVEPLNIHRVLADVLLLENTRATEKSVHIEVTFDPSLPEVLGNDAQLQQLFLNVVKNAIGACPNEGGQLRVATRMENSFYVATGSGRVRYIAVEISDNGPGLDDETREQMFTPFFTRSAGGTGLGLTIARNIALAHRGQISAENVEGGGACFRITLPVAEAATVESP